MYEHGLPHLGVQPYPVVEGDGHMRIIVTGQTGIAKSQVLGNLLRQLRVSCGYPEDGSGALASQFCRDYSVENSIEPDPTLFVKLLSLNNERVLVKRWEIAIDSLRARITDDPSTTNVFLSMHSTFFRRGKFFSPLNLEKLRWFTPDLFITLVDDVYDIWWRLRERAKHLNQSGVLRMREVMAWRSVEVMMTDFIAKNLIPGRELPNYVVAVKQPAETLVKLLATPDAMRVYASYPIARTRDIKKKREDIDKYRLKLHKRFVTFDPVGIDERVLKFSYDRWAESKPQAEVIELRRQDRWSVPSDACDLPILADSVEYPDIIDEIDPVQIREVLDVLRGRPGDVNEHIVWRDYRLIDQAHCLAAYRPNYEGQKAEGVGHEIDYAHHDDRVYVYQFYPQDDGDFALSPFGNKGSVSIDYDGFVEMLELHQRQTRMHHTNPSHFGNLVGCN